MSLQNLTRYPRLEFIGAPTPLEYLPRFSDYLGRDIFIKRDDVTPMAMGGNKLRKLEFLAADALREGADTLITAGAIQSNHVRQTAAVAAKLGLNCVAISSIDKGQWEAAASIGMTPWQTLRRAILPQAARVALPPLSNSFISLVKDTSLAATIQVPELFRQAQLITSRTLEVFTMYLAASLIYWIMATVLSALQNYFENQLNRQERDPK